MFVKIPGFEAEMLIKGTETTWINFKLSGVLEKIGS